MTLVYIALAIIWLAILVRAVLRPHRQPASRVAWVLVIVLLPGMGILFYILLGETNIGRKRVEHSWTVLDALPPAAPASFETDSRFRPEFPEIIGARVKTNERRVKILKKWWAV
jgi:cardiolipin synthase